MGRAKQWTPATRLSSNRARDQGTWHSCPGILQWAVLALEAVVIPVRDDAVGRGLTVGVHISTAVARLNHLLDGGAWQMVEEVRNVGPSYVNISPFGE